MISSPPRPTVLGYVHEQSDGSADVIPYVLPLHVPAASMTMTVRDWLGLEREVHTS